MNGIIFILHLYSSGILFIKETRNDINWNEIDNLIKDKKSSETCVCARACVYTCFNIFYFT